MGSYRSLCVCVYVCMCVCMWPGQWPGTDAFEIAVIELNHFRFGHLTSKPFVSFDFDGATRMRSPQKIIH